jgi:predicted aspartyl protease
MRGIGALIAFLALAVLAGQAWASSSAEQPYRIDSHGRLVTDVYVDGHGPFTFLIDTASSRSLIFEHVRKQLGLAQSQPERLTIYGINDVAEVMPVKPSELRVAGESVRGLTLGVLPDSENSGPDGVLGIDILTRYFVVLDRGAMRLKLLPPGEDSTRAYAGWSRVDLTPRPLKKFSIQFWYLNSRFNGERLTALFDLGAGMTMMNWGAAERLGVHKYRFTANGPPPEELQDVLGKKAPAVRIEGMEVRLMGRSWNRQMVIVADAPVFGYFDLEEQPAAIMGTSVLGDNSLAIDFAGQHLFIGPTEKESD